MRPVTPQRFRTLAAEIQRDDIWDWDLYHLCQENPLYQLQLDTILREPQEKMVYALQVAEKAAVEASRHLRACLRRTNAQRRSYLKQRTRLHKNRFPLHLQRKAEATQRRHLLSIDNKKWQRFLISATEYRCHQAASWCAREDLPMVTGQIWIQEPYNLVQTWPEGSQCPIDPQPVVYTIPARNIIPEGNAPATVIPVEVTSAQRIKALKAYYVYLEQQQQHDKQQRGANS